MIYLTETEWVELEKFIICSLSFSDCVFIYVTHLYCPIVVCARVVWEKDFPFNPSFIILLVLRTSPLPIFVIVEYEISIEECNPISHRTNTDCYLSCPTAIAV